MRQGSGRTQGWWAACLLGQWETGNAQGCAQSLLLFSGPAKRYLMSGAERPDMNPFPPLRSGPWLSGQSGKGDSVNLRVDSGSLA